MIARLPDTPLNNNERVEPVWVEANARPGELPCTRCSTPNGPERQFCKHCGAPLAEGVAAVEVGDQATHSTWWHRFRSWVRRKTGRVDTASLATTARRMSSGGPAGRTMAFRSGALLLVGALLFSFLGPFKVPVRSGARRLLGGDRYTAIPTADIQVTSLRTADDIEPATFVQEDEHNVLDRFANTSWATRWVTDATPGSVTPPAGSACTAPSGTDSKLVFSFTKPTTLSRIRILGGRFKEDPACLQFARPRLVELKLGDKCQYAELSDDGSLTNVKFSHRKVEQVELRIVDIVKDDEQSHTVEISEVIFERRR